MNRLQILLFSLLVGISLISCATVKPRVAFDASMEKYNNLIRWGDFDRAALFALPAVSEEYRDRVKSAKDVRITDYQIIDVRYDEKTEEASAVVIFSYYLLTSGVVTKVTDNQKWVYIDEGENKVWKLMSLLPEFR